MELVAEHLKVRPVDLYEVGDDVLVELGEVLEGGVGAAVAAVGPRDRQVCAR